VGNKVVHFEVIGKDGKKLQDFYSSLFGWKIDSNNPMNYGMVDAAQAGIGGGISAGQDESQRYATFYVEVADPKATLEKAKGMGGQTIMEPMPVPGGPEIAMFSDPEGNMIGLVKEGSGPQ
jgi:predicted enzyme related to lactoylglutathione lyase